MTEVTSRELRRNTGALLDRVAGGESLTITVDGRAVALLGPVQRRPRWLSREEFVRNVVRLADDGLRTDLAALVGDEATDDLPFR